jgi:selenocysteine-specific translation elongation factor
VNLVERKIDRSVRQRGGRPKIIVYRRTDGGKTISFLDSSDFPGRIQGVARIASLADHALYLYPKSGSLSTPDGELAVLLTAAGVGGTLEILDGSSAPESARGALRGTAVAEYRVEERATSSSAIDLSNAAERSGLPSSGTLIYVDRVFSVKGVGTVALGFVLSGEVHVHDSLRPIPGVEGLRLDVRGVQINDQDVEGAGRGIRVGLSLRGAEAEELKRTRWLDDGSFELSDDLGLEFEKSSFYRLDVENRDLHLQLPGEMVNSRLEAGTAGLLRAKLPIPVPVWDGMRVVVLDLNGKSLRVAGGARLRHR